MAKKPFKWWKFFGLLTLGLVGVYFVGTWYEDYSGATWIVPADWVILGAIISAIVAIICYIRKK